MSKVWEDPRVVRGMKEQLRRRKELLRAGQRAVGWKAAFGAPAALERLRLAGPLSGFLLRSGLLSSGATVSLADWYQAAFEPEMAVYFGQDIPGGSDRERVRAAVAALGPAIELADLVGPAPTPDNLGEVLAANIFQRQVILGARDASRAGGVVHGLTGSLLCNGSEVARTSDPEALTGETIEVVRQVADLLAAFGERLRAGEFLITGSIVPPLKVQAGDEIVYRLEPFEALSVRFAT